MSTNIASVNRTTPDVVRPSTPARTAANSAAPAGSEGNGNTDARQAATEGSPSAVGEAGLRNVIQEANQYFQSINRNLEFSVDEDVNRTVVRVVDTDTGELIRQIPSEEMLQLARHMREMEKATEGMFFNAQV